LQLPLSVGGSLHVTFEEGTWAAWLHDLLKPHVAQLLVCDPREHPGKSNKQDDPDRNDARTSRAVVAGQALAGLSRRTRRPNFEGTDLGKRPSQNFKRYSTIAELFSINR